MVKQKTNEEINAAYDKKITEYATQAQHRSHKAAAQHKAMRELVMVEMFLAYDFNLLEANEIINCGQIRAITYLHNQQIDGKFSKLDIMKTIYNQATRRIAAQQTT